MKNSSGNNAKQSFSKRMEKLKFILGILFFMESWASQTDQDKASLVMREEGLNGVNPHDWLCAPKSVKTMRGFYKGFI